MSIATPLAEVITCPSCCTEIPLTQVVESKIRSRLVAEMAQERQHLEHQQKQLAERTNAISKMQDEIELRIQEGIVDQRNELLKTASENARKEVLVQINDQATELSELRRSLKTAQENELAMRQNERRLKERAESLELEVARRLEKEREAVRRKAMHDSEEANSLKQAEKDKQIADLRHKIDELKQKAEQGSVQLQGEVLELAIEATLRDHFPLDAIGEVPKGVNGADVQQTVVSAAGRTCGSILWETKRTKKWSTAWVAKLKDDQRQAGADIAVIVSEALPPEISTIGCVDGVWVCSRSCVAGLASVLRAGLTEVAKTRQAAEGRGEKVQLVYQYLSGPAFQQRIAGIVESFVGSKKIWQARSGRCSDAGQNVKSSLSEQSSIQQECTVIWRE